MSCGYPGDNRPCCKKSNRCQSTCTNICNGHDQFYCSDYVSRDPNAACKCKEHGKVSGPTKVVHGNWTELKKIEFFCNVNSARSPGIVRITSAASMIAGQIVNMAEGVVSRGTQFLGVCLEGIPQLQWVIRNTL